MAMVIRNNLNAINAHNNLANNVRGTRSASEKLSSGFRINRAGDDAAGLAISEKMRAQLRGLGQAIRNANDGISLIQTAEGALDETHSMLKRLKELSVQAGNDTYTAEERDFMQMEIDAILTEIDRISIATDFNGIKLLDGSLDGVVNSTNYGAQFGSFETRAGVFAGSTVTASREGVVVEFRAVGGNNGAGGYATWDEDGMRLTVNINQGQVFTQAELDEWIKNAAVSSTNQNSIPDVNVTLGMGQGVIDATGHTFGATVQGVRASATGSLNQFFHPTSGHGNLNSADRITFTSNNFGEDSRIFRISTDTANGRGNESVSSTSVLGDPNRLDEVITINLAAGETYSGEDISRILAQAGFDYSVDLSSSINPDGKIGFQATVNRAATIVVDMGGAAPPEQQDNSIGLNTLRNHAAVTALRDAIDGAGEPSSTDMSDVIALLTAFNTATGENFTLANAGTGAQRRLDALAFLADLDALDPADMDDNLPITIPGFSATDVSVLGNNITNFDRVLNWATSAINELSSADRLSDAALQAIMNAVNNHMATGDMTATNYNAAIATIVGGGFSFTTTQDPVSVFAAGQDGPGINAALGNFNTASGMNFQPFAAFSLDASMTEATALERLQSMRDSNDRILSMATSARSGQGVGNNRMMSTGQGLTFQIGANNAVEQRVTLNIKDMGARALGVANFDVSSKEAAGRSNDMVNGAISRVSAQRASLGAMQNRLEYTVNSLTVTSENLTAAESQIRDADMAKEMIEFTKFNILQQAAQAMLAQANQAPQAILQLLR